MSNYLRSRHLLPVGFTLLFALVMSAVLVPDAWAQRKKEEPKKEEPKKAPRNWREASHPLHIAAFDGDQAAMRKLLSAKEVDVNVLLEFRTFPGYTPLHLAAYEGHAKIIDMLAAKKADLNRGEKSKKRTPLHLAASYGRTEAVRSLIKAGADINAKDKLNNTALRLASEKAIIAELKKAGATEE